MPQAPAATCVTALTQAHRLQAVDAASVMGTEEAETAQQGTNEATEPAWDLMKLLPSTLGDPSTVDIPGEPALDAVPMDREVHRTLTSELAHAALQRRSCFGSCFHCASLLPVGAFICIPCAVWA